MMKSSLRSTERIPAALLDQPRTSEINEQASAAWAENYVLVLDVSMDWTRNTVS